jgi:protein TonB
MLSMGGAAGGDPWTGMPRRKRGGVAAVAVALAVHAAVAAALLVVDPSLLAKKETVVEMVVEEKTPPPPEVRPEPTPPPKEPEPAPKPRIVPRRVAVAPPKEPPRTAAPPPPNQEPPPKAAEEPPIFGGSLSSVVAGDKAAMAIPVGNTLMTKDRTMAKPGQTPKPYAAEGTHPIAPTPDIYIAQPARVIHEVNSADVYPAEAYRMGIEGMVELKVTVDENGNVIQVRVLTHPGHGFEEAAREAMRQFKFSPARTSDGKATVQNITYKFSFDMSH